ncbi:ABC transporter permease [Rhizobium sp. CG4]|nr:ABC transporter permease [Rhizobium sp. CG4]
MVFATCSRDDRELAYLVRKLFNGLIALLAMTFIVFVLQSVIPADPARLIAGPAAPTATIEALRMKLGLEEPIGSRYIKFLVGVAHGDFGTSVRTRQPVLADILKYLPATLELAFVAMSIGVLSAIGLAVLQATYPSVRLLRVTFVGLGAAPVVLTSLLLVYFIWFKLDWLPGSGRLSVRGYTGPTGFYLIDTLLSGDLPRYVDALRHLILPAIALAIPITVAVGQVLSSSLLDVLRQGYIRTARGKGLSMVVVILRHGLRNAANGALTMGGLQVRLLFGNMLIVERIFGWPGLGFYMVQALAYSDVPAILGIALLLGAFYVMVATVVEITQRIADPRIAVD